MPGFKSEEGDDNLFDAVSAMADRMGLEGEKRATYIDDHMLQGGYTRVQSRDSYARVKEEGDQQASGSRWGFRGGGSSSSGDGDRF